jgi:hypothetical protein
MAVHRVSGLRLAADIPLPELPRVRDTRTVDFRFRLLAPRRRPAAPQAWLYRWREEDGSAWISLGRTRHGYLVRFARVADFLLSRDASTIGCHARPRVPALTVRHLLLDQVIPMVLGHRGHLAIHASAVVAAGGVLAFAGKAGWGKSTLCASLARSGRPALADDCVVIEERRGCLVAVPSYPGLRLWPDAARVLGHGRGRSPLGGVPVADYSDKRRVDPRRRRTRRAGAAPLSAIYVLAPPGTAKVVRISRLVPREAVGRLLAHTHRLDVTDRARLTAELDALGRLAGRVPVFELAFPRDLRRLPRLRAAVLRHAAGL